MKNKTLIIGLGEIGKSLGRVLGVAYHITGYDKTEEFMPEGEFDVVNICYPYSKNFVKITKDYIKHYKPKLTIIHSTVPVGTTRKVGGSVVHSPVNGRHPNLEHGIKTFSKFIGGTRGEDSYGAEVFLKKAGIKVIHFASSEATELAKILCTTQYGWHLVFMKEVEKLCQKHNTPFHEVYNIWNLAYNEGYKQLGESQFNRPVLRPMKGKIGGHCVLNNCKLLDTFVTKVVKSKGGSQDDLQTGT